MNNPEEICSVCHQAVLTEYYFCPNCGNNLKEKPQAISALVQAGIYTLAIFVPPLGLWPGLKYLTKKGESAKRVGIIAIALTLISSILTIWAIFSLFSSYLNQMNSFLY